MLELELCRVAGTATGCGMGAGNAMLRQLGKYLAPIGIWCINVGTMEGIEEQQEFSKDMCPLRITTESGWSAGAERS
jgi:hypothetical protein